MYISLPSAPPSPSRYPAPKANSALLQIGINLTDPVYTGLYHGTQRHENDLSAVVQRAIDIGCEKLIVTGSDLEHSQTAVRLAEEYRK